MKGMSATVDRLLQARDGGEVVAIFGDYDADGVTSTALMVECLASIGVKVIPYIPRRVEGYGLRSSALDRLHKEDGVTLVVAIDCGISASPEVDAAAELGVDVIIADHHHVPAVLPRAHAVINPHQEGCDYPFKDLSAVGIAYKIALGLYERIGRDLSEVEQWLDLVAIGTVADVVSLRGENRALVARGLPRLNPAGRIGLNALIQRASLSQGGVTARGIGYAIAPRLNAAGRLGDAKISLDLLLTTHPDVARKLAEDLEQANLLRQQLTSDAVELARLEIARREQRDGRLPKVLLIASTEFTSGLVGLVAGRLVEDYGRPALVAEIKDGMVRGSARSIVGFHLANALDECRTRLVRGGGHALAAGFTIKIEDWPDFQTEFENIGARDLTDDHLEPRLMISALLHPRKLPPNILDLLASLEPCGQDNRRPLFRSNGLRVVERRVVGKNESRHLKLKLADGATSWNAIGFGMGSRFAEAAAAVDVVYTIDRNDWEGREAVQFRLFDLRSSDTQS